MVFILSRVPYGLNWSNQTKIVSKDKKVTESVSKGQPALTVLAGEHNAVTLPIQNFAESAVHYALAQHSLTFNRFEFQLGETHCEPLECPPIHCSHPVVPQGHCCPVCLWQSFGHTHHDNNTSSGNGVCSFSGMTYLEGEVWKLNTPKVDSLATACSKCQCKVSYHYSPKS